MELDVVISDDDDQIVASADELAEPLEHALMTRDDALHLLLRLALAEAEPVETIFLVVVLFGLGEDHDGHEVDHVAVDDQLPRPIIETLFGIVLEELLELALEGHQMTQVRHVCPTRPQIFAEVQIGNDEDVLVQRLSRLRHCAPSERLASVAVCEHAHPFTYLVQMCSHSLQPHSSTAGDALRRFMV